MEDIASTMEISAEIASTYLDHESADLTRLAFGKLGANAARNVLGAVHESNQTDVSFRVAETWAVSSVGRALAF